MAREIDHKRLLEAALAENAERRLAWLRNPSAPYGTGRACAQLLGLEGQESLEQALRDRRYHANELKHLPGVLADLARERVVWGGRRWLSGWLAQPLALGSSEQLPVLVLGAFSEPANVSTGPTAALRALAGGLDLHAVRMVELRERAEEAAQAQLSAVSRRLRPRAEPTPLPAAQTAQSEQGTSPPQPGVLELARDWLSRTDDAARELSRWLIKRTERSGGESELARLLVALRATELDGLARPARRFYRLSEGARRLGFERDMNARMHGESAAALLLPLPACVPLTIPHDVRVLDPALSYGILVDLAVAQGIGEGLANALTSPATGQIVARQHGMSVSGAVGGLFAQLRASAEYLRRVDALERDVAQKVGRHAALWLLLQARLYAATVVATHEPVRTNAERVTQLVAAGERALGLALPAGVMALQALAATSPAERFSALFWGLELHSALRERFDEDFYLNPRVSEVLRGAAARGADLDAAGFCAELGASGSAAVRRITDLLG